MAIDYEEISKLSVFASLEPLTLERLADYTLHISCKAGTVFFEQGDVASGLHILSSGQVILYRQSREKSQILSIVSSTQCFGGESIPNETPCPYTAKAITATKYYFIASSQVHILLNEHPDFLSCYLEVISRRLRQLTNLVHKLAFHDVTSRVAGVLLTLAESDSELTEDGLRIPRVLSQKDLASMVGTAREVVYRTVRQFEEEGVLRQTRAAYFILELDRLVEIASEETH